MSKRIAFIHGSPRKKGNTRNMANVAIQAAKNGQAEVVEIDAVDLEFKVPGCASCYRCQQSDGFLCAVDDQLSATVASLVDYDVIALAIPTYWMSYPAQVKMLVDRMGSLMKFSCTGEIRTPLAGKQFAILATGNSGLGNNLDLLEQQWRNVAGYMSCGFHACLYPNVPQETGALEREPEAVEKARDFGKLLASA